MDECQRLNSKRRDIKASATKLITKVEDMMSANLEGISNQTVSESKKLLAETTLAHLKQKKGQILELDDAIGEKIEAAQVFEEEITNANTYQTNLDERIVFLSEFIRKAGMPPPELQLPLPSMTAAIPAPSTLTLPETSGRSDLPSNSATDPIHVSTSMHSPVLQVTRLPKLLLPTFSGDPLTWQMFWDSFDAAVNKNVGLSGV